MIGALIHHTLDLRHRYQLNDSSYLEPHVRFIPKTKLILPLVLGTRSSPPQFASAGLPFRRV